MSNHPPIREVTRQNVEAIAKMEEASINLRTFGERLADGPRNWLGAGPFSLSKVLCW